MVRLLTTIVTSCLVAAALPALAQSRGELLYTTHCVACHTTQMHWRNNRLASDWAGLTLQVQRWQGAASLAWSERDVLDVSNYLNDTIYHFQKTAAPPASLGQSGKTPVER
jgi:mono/diheme cytochrome c family protein